MRTIAAGCLIVVGLLTTSAPADAATAPKKFSSCAAIHTVYSGGIAKPGVTKNTLTKNGKKIQVPLSGRVAHSSALYNLNKGLDRDHDGVACEVA